MTSQERLIKRLSTAVIVLLYALIAVALMYHQKNLTLQRTQDRAMLLADALDTANERADRNEVAAKRWQKLEQAIQRSQTAPPQKVQRQVNSEEEQYGK